MVSKVEISHKTIVFTLVLLAALWLVIQIRDILFLLFIAFILMSALRPVADWLTKLRLPRILAILFIYILLFGVVGASLAGTIPSLVAQSSKLLQVLPALLGRVSPFWSIDAESMVSQIAPISDNILKVTVGIFSNIITTFTVLVFTFYFLLEYRHTEMVLTDFMGEAAARRVLELIKSIEKRLGAWLRGEIFLMFLIGLLVYIGLSFLRIDFALPLAILAGILEIVPTIGPVISGIPAVLVALATSPFLALTVVALYFIIQQVENTIVVPWVMKRSVGLPPLVTILALLVGGRLAGLTGAVLAVPMVLVLQAFFGFYFWGSGKKK